MAYCLFDFNHGIIALGSDSKRILGLRLGAMGDPQRSPTHVSRVWSAFKSVLVYALVGATVAGIIVSLWVILPSPSPGSSRAWSLLVAPIFAAIAAVVGAILGGVVGLIRVLAREWRN